MKVEVTCSKCPAVFVAGRKDARYCVDCKRAADTANSLRYRTAPGAKERIQAMYQARHQKKREDSLGRQPERCDICGVQFDEEHKPNWDHSHARGRCHRHNYSDARGWLCQGCNAGIGQLGDNPAILKRAAAYLEARGHFATRPVIR